MTTSDLASGPRAGRSHYVQRRPLCACPDCGTIQALPLIPRGRLDCRACHATLEHATGRSLDAALACGLAVFVLLFPMNFAELLWVSKAGITVHGRLVSGIGTMWTRGWVLTATAVALQGTVLPFLRFGLLCAVLSAIRLGRVGRWTGPAFRWGQQLDSWAMPDVYLIGFLIGYGRLVPFVAVHIGPGGYCLGLAALLTMLTRAVHDRRMTWRRIYAPAAPPAGETIGCPACDLVLPAARAGRRCPRCGLRVWRRKPSAMPNAVALVLAGYALYPLSNVYPLSIITVLGHNTPHTLFWSVVQLVQANLLPLACLIFLTSIIFPFAKLAGMTWLFVSIWRRSRRHLIAKTRTFRFIDEIGRWSNADIFTLAVYMPLVQFGQFAEVHLGIGTPALQMLVVLTMFASIVFDPRLVWDAAQIRR